MAPSFVPSRGIFPLFAASVLFGACSSDPAAPGGAAGQSSVAGSTSNAGTGGAAAGAGGGQSGSASGGGVQGGSGGNSSGATGGAAAGTNAVAGGGSGGSSGGGGTAASGGNAGSAGSGGGGGSGPGLKPCADPAVSRLKVWEMQVVGGTQVPANGSPLRKYDGGGYELYVEWTLTAGGAYGTANAPLNNMGQYTNGADPAKNAVDISKGDGLTIEYASTGNTYLQLRTAAVPHGGDHFRADLPSTGGQIKTVQLPYASFRRPGGNTPPGADILTGMFSFTFVGSATTKLTLRQVLIPGFVPPCQ
jgi:hypothetical protein